MNKTIQLGPKNDLGWWRKTFDPPDLMPMKTLPPHVIDELTAGKVAAAKNLGMELAWSEAREKVMFMLESQNRYRALKRWEEQGLIRWDSRGQGKWVVKASNEEFLVPDGEIMTEPTEGFFANIALAIGAVG